MFGESPRGALAAALLLGLTACARTAERPHVLLVTVDTLRADHLSLDGYARETSPAIDAFAREATRFTNALALVPKTAPSMASHLSGLPPCQHGVRTNLLSIPADVPLVAELLAAAGYETVAFVANPVLWSGKGFERGFARYVQVGPEGDPGAQFVRGGTRQLNARFLKWARAADWSRPTFVWLHYLDPHGPYNPEPEHEALFLRDELARADRRRVPIEYEPRSEELPNQVLGAIPRYQVRGEEDRAAAYVARYDAEIRAVDEALGEVLAFLRTEGLFDRAAIVLTSDHGESLGERDYWFEHGWFAGEATLRIPLVVKPPSGPLGALDPPVPPDQRRVDVLVSSLDTMPTILRLAGVEPPAGLIGRSLLGPLDGRGPLLLENTPTYPERYFALRAERYKLVRAVGTGSEQLFDALADPGEVRDLSGELPELAERLRSSLDAALEACASSARRAEAASPASAEEARALEALGYTGH